MTYNLQDVRIPRKPTKIHHKLYGTNMEVFLQLISNKQSGRPKSVTSTNMKVKFPGKERISLDRGSFHGWTAFMMQSCRMCIKKMYNK